MNNPKVSVVVPVYNVEKYLKRCLNSLVNQTLKDIEIVIIDDGSTDNSPNICDEYAKQDQRIKVIHKDNQGLGFARNTGLKEVSGEYVGFVDSDDFVEVDTYEKLYTLAKKENVDMITCNYFSFNSTNKEKQRVCTISDNKIVLGEDLKKLACQLVGKDPRKNEDDIGMSVWKNLYSTKFLKENNYNFCSEREFVSEDAIFDLSVVTNMNKVLLITDSFYSYCVNGSLTLSSTFRESKFEEYKKLYLKEAQLLEKYNYYESGKYYIATTFLGNIRAHIKQLVRSELSKKEQLDLISNIVNDDLVRSVFDWYPYKLTSFSQKIFSISIKNKKIVMIRRLGLLQNMRSNIC